jgi:hypothetical protein
VRGGLSLDEPIRGVLPKRTSQSFPRAEGLRPRVAARIREEAKSSVVACCAREGVRVGGEISAVEAFAADAARQRIAPCGGADFGVGAVLLNAGKRLSLGGLVWHGPIESDRVVGDG